MQFLATLALGLLAGHPVQPYAHLTVVARGKVPDSEIMARVAEMRAAVAHIARVPPGEIRPDQCPVKIVRKPLRDGDVPHTTVSVRLRDGE